MRQFKLLIGTLIGRSLHSAIITGFDSNEPILPSEPLDLVVENVWQFDDGDLPHMLLHLLWVPGNDRVVTAHKSGQIRVYESIDSDVEDYVEVINIYDQVYGGDDHGLLSFAFHPNFKDGDHSIFIMYTGNPKNVELLPNNDVVSPIRPEDWGTYFETGGYEWPHDLCTNLEDNNLEGRICEKIYYIDRYSVDFYSPVPTAVKDITLFAGVCGSSTTHGPGTITEMDGDLIFSMGEGSQYEFFDPGFPDLDGCYVPEMGLDQGVFRSQRDEFAHGKIYRIPVDLLNSEEEISIENLIMVSKGNRQPFRMFYQKSKDRLYVADVGMGDGGTTERIFSAENVSSISAAEESYNWGWPCIEGVHSSVSKLYEGIYAPYDSDSEKERTTYLQDNDLPLCDGIKLAVEALVSGEDIPENGDLRWRAPIFEYRSGEIDPEYPDYCTLDDNAAITSVFVYEGYNLPELYSNKLMFSDHIKKCLWYFDNDEDGNPITSSPPHVLIANAGFVDIQKGHDGIMYAIDYINARVIRIFGYGMGPDAGIDTPPPTMAPTAAPISLPGDIPTAEYCFDPIEMPELEWIRNADGSYEGDLVLGAVEIITDAGISRTRAYNGMIPGPLIRMKPCGIYHLNLYNDQADWPDGVTSDIFTNGLFSPSVTNLHLHGLHISGEEPGDNVFTKVLPGEVYQYTYIVPCDHSGGTNWYHPHHHGSTALQTDAGAAGMLIIESSPREASDMPMAIQSMPEQFLMIQEFNPSLSKKYAFLSGDYLYETTALDSYRLVNGCDNAVMAVEEGQWTRLHIVNVGTAFNSVIQVIPVNNKAPSCDLGLMSKDGVWLSEVPRPVTNNKLFVSISSRLDVAIRCPTAENMHVFTYTHLLDPSFPETPDIILTVDVLPSIREPADDLPTWEPCRPAYLMDIADFPKKNFMDSFSLEVRSALNSFLFTNQNNYILEVELNKPQKWFISVTDIHPFHMHINHMQLGNITDSNQYLEVNDWFVEGDWIDSLSAPGVVEVYIRSERYVGPMVMHCHIAQHSDIGVMNIVNIVGDGDEGGGSPAITDFGTCPEFLPESVPFNGVAASIPGTVKAVKFDLGGEGIAYHNINIARNIGNTVRKDESVEIIKSGQDAWIGYIRNGEWLKYTISSTARSTYRMTVNIAAPVAPANGLKFSVWLNQANSCPPPGQLAGKLAAVEDLNYAGSGSEIFFENYVIATPVYIPAGENTVMICFEGGNLEINFNSFTLVECVSCE